MGGGNVAVPMKNGNSAVAQKRVDALKLVVDQAFQGRYIENVNRFRKRAFHFADDGKKDGLRFSRSRIGGKDQIVVGVKNNFCRFDLNGTNGFPPVCINKILYERGKAIENLGRIHEINLSKKNSARAVGRRRN